MTLTDIHQALLPRLPQLARELLPGGAQSNGHWKSDTLEVDLKTGVWHDTESQEQGDVLELISSVRMLPLGKAAAWAKDWLGPLPAPEPTPMERQLRRAAIGLPVNNGEFDPLEVGYKTKEETVWRHGTKAFTYRSATGDIIGYSVLFANGQILPLRIIDGKPKWTGWKHPALKPVYNLHLLAERPEAPVIICGSEPAADAAMRLFPGSIGLSWLGRPGNVSSCDWSPIDDRISSDPSAKYPDGAWANPGGRVILWPDADKPGREAMLYLKARFPSALMVRTEDLPDGWDLADPVPAGVSLQGLYDAAGQAEPEPVTPPAEAPFRCIGISDSVFHYLSYLSGDIIALEPGEHTELNLQLIAPDSYWFSKGFHNERSPGLDYKAVAKHLIAIQHQIPRYSSDRIRGRGCWLEPSRIAGQPPTVVFHAGDKLFVNGVETPLSNHVSPWYYTAASPLEMSLARVASVDDMKPFIELCELLPYAPNQLSWILPAACFLGPVCGALDWRPDLWLTGEHGCGKSWIYKHILSAIFANICLRAVSSTTEAGIRQALHGDAFPVIFDEIESKDERARARIAQILELIRQSSSETGASIHKGTATGRAKSFSVRSSFILCSIARTAMEAADESRFATLEFSKSVRTGPDGRDRFRRIHELLEITLKSPAWIQAFHARVITLIPQIRTSVEIFTRAIEEICDESRKGQQFGTLAAGFWHMTSDRPPTLAEASAWAGAIPWPSLGSGDSSDSDPNRCLDILLQHKTSWQDEYAHKFDCSIGDLVSLWNDGSKSKEPISTALSLCGLFISRSGLHIPSRHVQLERIYAQTPFAGRWKEHFCRIPGTDQTVFKLAKRSTKGVRIPLSEILGDPSDTTQ